MQQLGAGRIGSQPSARVENHPNGLPQAMPVFADLPACDASVLQQP